MAAIIRTKILTKVFGGGAGGVVGAAAVSFAMKQLRQHDDPEVLDVSKLVPGETYTVVTRPAPTRKVRKLEKKASKAESRLSAELAPTRQQRRAERELKVATRKAAKAKADTRRYRKSATRAEAASRRRAALAAPTSRQRKLERRAAALEVALAAKRTAQLEKAAKGTRTVRRRFS